MFHAAATLFSFGTDEQRAQHLPAILRGETWCQGFSEPEAGSDLAGLRTRAVRTGDEYVVNGQKIWSSDAVGADFCLLLARTDPSAPKRRGISYFILDMNQPGIDVRPIRQSTGEQEFNEVFLTDVRIPVADRIGADGEGWSIAQRTLSEERGTTIVEMAERLRGSVQLLRADVQSYVRAHEGTSLASDAAQQFATVHAEAEVLRLLCHQMIRDLVLRGGAGPESSIIKLYYSEILQRVTNLGVRMAGLPGQLARPLTRGVNWESGDWMIDYVGSWGWTIGGGTSEILKTVVAERVLEMPRERGCTVTAVADLDERAELQKSVRGRVSAGGGTGPARSAYAGDADAGAELWQAAGDLGWLGLELPEPHGAGVTFAEVAVVLHEFGRVVAPVPALGQLALGAGVATLAGPRAARWQQRLADGSLGATAALTGPDGTPGVPAFTATTGAAGLVVSGACDSVPDAAGADLVVVAAARDDGTRVVVALEAGVSGLEVAAQPVLDCSRSLAHVVADRVAVPADAVLAEGDEADELIAVLIDRAAVAVAVDCVAGAERVLEMTVGHLRQRHQFGRPLATFQALKHRASTMFPARGGGPRGDAARGARRRRPASADARGVDREVDRRGVVRLRRGRGRAVARRHRLHLGTRHAHVPQTSQAQRTAVRRDGLAPRPHRSAHPGVNYAGFDPGRRVSARDSRSRRTARSYRR